MVDALISPIIKSSANPKTGLRVRPDLYDDEYSDEDYEAMLSMYEGTMQSIAEGEILLSRSRQRQT